MVGSVLLSATFFFRGKALFALLNKRKAGAPSWGESLRNLKLPDNSKLGGVIKAGGAWEGARDEKEFN